MMNTILPFVLEAGAVRTKKLRSVNSGKNVGIGKNVGKGFKNGFGATPFFEIVLNESDSGVCFGSHGIILKQTPLIWIG